MKAVTKSYKLSLTPRKAYYAEKPLRAIAVELATRAGIEVTVEHPDKRKLNYVQWAETDFDFLNRLVDDHGCWMRPSAEGIQIHDEFQEPAGQPLQWRDEFGLLEFSTRATLGSPSFSGCHYDHHQMDSQSWESVSEEPSFFGSIDPLVEALKTQSQQLPSGYLHQRSRAVKLDEFAAVLKKESVRSIGGNVTGRGRSRDPGLKPGDKVNIAGPLDAEGLYGLTAVRHRWTPEGYMNTFSCTPWKDYINPQSPRMRRWFGLVPARVVEHNDPKKMGRVRVQYIWQEEGPSHWARMMTPHAGADRGFMFLPEKGDEVIVGFEDGDPERPVILGCLWNGIDQAPRQDFWGGDIDQNDVKRIMTKSGHRVQFVDKPGKESIVMATPRFLKVSLIETTDETGRSMLTLHSDNGDIFLSAPNGRIHMLSKYYSREVGEPALDTANPTPE